MSFTQESGNKSRAFVLSPDGALLATITRKNGWAESHQEFLCDFTNKINGDTVTLSAIGSATDFHLVSTVGELREGQTGILRIQTPFFSVSPQLEITEGVDVAIAMMW
eukprot:355134-Chlamydomonas_euryale.AAC.6